MATAAPTKPRKTIPGKPEKKAKKAKVEKVAFLGTAEAKEFLGEEKKKIVKDPESGENRTKLIRRLNKVPTTWDGAKHKPLKKADFEPDSAYLLLEFRASLLEAQAERLRKEAKEEKMDSSKGVKAKKKKLGSLTSQISKILSELGDDPDVDVEEVLKGANIDPSLIEALGS